MSSQPAQRLPNVSAESDFGNGQPQPHHFRLPGNLELVQTRSVYCVT